MCKSNHVSHFLCSNTQGWAAVETKAKCLTSKWGTAGAEAKEIVNLYRSGEATVGDVKKHGTWLLIGALLFFAGEVVGRGSFVGYKLECFFSV